MGLQLSSFAILAIMFMVHLHSILINFHKTYNCKNIWQPFSTSAKRELYSGKLTAVRHLSAASREQGLLRHKWVSPCWQTCRLGQT